MGFDFIDMSITVQTGNSKQLVARLAEAGGTFRSACRTVVCKWPLTLCTAACPENESCGWNRVFGQGLASDPAAQKRHQKPPLPFSFSVRKPEAAKESPGQVELRLVVAGSAINCFEMLMEGFVLLLKSGSLLTNSHVIEIASLDLQGERHPLDLMAVLSSDWVVDGCPDDCKQLQLTFLSPLRMVSDGRQSKVFDFSLFARSIMRRVSSIAYYYGDYDFEVDFRFLASQAGNIACADDQIRLAYAPGDLQRVTGLIGQGRFEGEFSEMLPFLVLGGYFNAGKKSAYGMGSYRVDY